jgi:hypothetical protein
MCGTYSQIRSPSQCDTLALSLQLTMQWVVVTSPAGSLYALPCLVGVDRPPCFVRACVLSAAEAAAVVDLLCTGTPAVLGHSCDAAGGTGLRSVVAALALLCSPAVVSLIFSCRVHCPYLLFSFFVRA